MRPNTPQIIFGKIVREMIITENGCWEYHKSEGIRYSFVYLKGKGKTDCMMTHRFMWEFCTDEELTKDDEIMHTCDYGFCSNPTHLKKGTHKDNMQDMIRKGRQNYTGPVGAKRAGEKHPSIAGCNHPESKLKRNQVIEIRKTWDALENKYGLVVKLSKKYQVSTDCITGIVHRRTYLNEHD